MKIKIIEAYIKYVLLHGKSPVSVYAFVHENGMQEKDFYQYFSSFESVEQALIPHLFQETLQSFAGEDEFTAFSVKDKFLTVMYAFTNKLLSYRSFLLLRKNEKRLLIPSLLKECQLPFIDWADNLVSKGLSDKEIAGRPKITQYYGKIFWAEFLFIYEFWLSDTSAGFEKTDAAIEKSATVIFDLIAKSAIDSIFDFGKFLFQHKS
jgi:hypothetical protein